jgi:ATP-dependent helicase/nuclease subunit A
MITAYEKAVAAQAEAANPRFTRMVSANAGSGKTRVLVDRVSRILLQGVEPQHILCLTYTKAAATEMQDRLYDKLGNWSILEESALRKELNNLLGEDFDDIASARRLFAKALETPEGLKVQTIHAFCERVLSRFPIEAGIMPGFEPIEDTDIARLSAEVRAQILQLAMDDPKGALNQALQTLTVKMADQTLDGLFKWMAHAGEKVAKWEASGGIEGLAARLNLKITDTAKDLAKNFWAETDRETLEAAIPILAQGLKTDQIAATKIKESLFLEDALQAFYHYATVFMTSTGSLRKKPVTKKTMEATQDYFSAENTEALRVLNFFDTLNGVEVLTLTHAIFTLARPYVEIYAKAKRDRRGLDFNDQILLVKNLLNKKAVSDWVRYKLDGGIEHILLDEAQDTSPEQWEIINSLSEAFLQDSPDRDPNKPRTLFAVGDEKQSIYGFQGAKPEQFLTEIQSRLVGEAKQVRMSMSFRSSQTILNVVDCFLNEQGGQRAMFDAEVFPPASDIEPHAAHRNDEGLVELWPLSLKPEKGEDKSPWDTTPVDALGDGDEREVLARELALKIKGWLKNGEAIFDRNIGRERAMQAGDILILVRTRGGRNSSLYDAIIRHLKRQSIPLAGADRIKLTDAMIVRDLLSLSRWVLLPSDDLSLAEVLKGPIFGFDDMKLLELAKGRGQQNLWSAVRDRDPKLSEKLQELIYLSQSHAPYEFYSAVLDVLDERQESNRKKFYRRLGLEAREALEVFLNRAMDHQSKGVPNLQYFIRSFQDDDAEVKRDMDAAKDQVRVMTVHGAKGLEAPVVILPDTTQVPIFKEALIPIEEGYFLKPTDKLLPEALAPFVENGKQRQHQEQLRLLYVALTRVESRLIICGHQVGSEKNPAKENSWYDWMQRVFESLPTTKISTPFGDGQCYGKIPALAESQLSAADEIASLPDWALRSAPDELPLTQRLNPSNLLSDEAQGVDSDHAENGLTPKNRGIIIHQLLEVLPNLKPAQRQEKAMSILQTDTEISQEHQAEILSEVFGVLENSEFSFLWEEGSLAEVNLGGRISQFSVSHEFAAQIDRLCIQNDKIIIVDFKSNRIVPETEEGVDDIYWGQMAAYRALVQGVYPGKAVECALLWTAAPKLMWLSSQKLDHALTQIDSLLT